MQVNEKTKGEIEIKANSMSDFLKMEYLESCLKKFTDIEIKRYCYIELSKLYEKNHMYSEAIKYIVKFQEITISKREKIQSFIREIELLIKGEQYDRVEYAYKKISEIGTNEDLYKIKRIIISLYDQAAGIYEKNNKYSQAQKVYERLVKIVTDNERIEVKRRLLNSYKKLGKIREAIELEKELSRV